MLCFYCLFRDAVDGKNVFHSCTYSGCADYTKLTEKTLYQSWREQIISFGQTPIQLFSSNHPPVFRL
jgi:hypothetical protein